MNILLLTTHLRPGGISRYVINLAKGFKALNHKVWVAACGGEWSEKLKVAGIPILNIPIDTKCIFSPKIYFSAARLKSFILSNPIDIFHANTRVTQILAKRLNKELPIPYISAFHGFYRPTLWRRFIKAEGMYTIAVSESVKRHLLRDFKFSPQSVKVVYNGIDFDEFSPRKNQKEKYGFSRGQLLLGIMGRVSEEKGHFLAAEALKKLSLRYKNVSLVISGEGKMMERLRAYITDLGINDKVHFVNLEPDIFFNVIDILLVPSKREGFGYSIIEAFVKGVPVVGYNTGGIAEIIKDGENGLLFHHYNNRLLAEKLEEAVSDKALINKITQKAREDVIYYSSKRMALDTERIYKEVVL